MALLDTCDLHAGSERILLIERDPAVARSLELLMASAGLSVDMTAEGAEGLSFAGSGAYGIVVLGPNPPELTDGDLRASLRLGRLDASYRFLSVSVSTEPGGNTMQITPCS